MPAGPKRHYGTHDFNLGEHRYVRVHLYATLSQMTGDVSTAQARWAYVLETQRMYWGRPGAWVEVPVTSPLGSGSGTPGPAAVTTMASNGAASGQPALPSPRRTRTLS